jgi:hypothetical protein
MKKYDYSKIEYQINKVLNYQNEELYLLQKPSMEEVDDRISESEVLLKSLGYDKQLSDFENGKKNPDKTVDRKVLVVPSWEHLCNEAEMSLATGNDLESIFTKEELKSNLAYIKKLNEEYNTIHKLDKYDISISAVAGLLGAAIDILLVGIPNKTPDGLKGGVLANYIRDQFDKEYPEDEMTKLANSKISKVPYDAQDNRQTVQYVDGLSTYYHRLLSLGHDPLLGLLFGVKDILTGRMTTIDKSGKIAIQVIEGYKDRKESDIFSAIVKQIIHFKSDITSSMGLPAPLMGLFNLLQFGNIGEEDQTIAQIVQGMYYEGYDFIHFCTLSIPVMIVEAVIRISYAIKRIKEGHSVKESIPISLNREKNPKLSTMLFIGHAAATAANAGKIYFTQNPMAINYPQWIAFGKYSYTQLKWILIDKPSQRASYTDGVLNENLEETLSMTDLTFDKLSTDYIVVIE